ncbi:hypothetical protein [Desulfosporosinus orientis]|uniref:hypothetical protein n=1 Tax=Desulfosporosinus orientis TaxID=1563 RepID=UPI0013052A96|nr:hypothetical protein [Desulfosporosinus orientis]
MIAWSPKISQGWGGRFLIDYVVYSGAKAKELELLLMRRETDDNRRAAGRKILYDKI